MITLIEKTLQKLHLEGTINSLVSANRKKAVRQRKINEKLQT